MPFERAVLGRPGLEVGRLGISASYGVPAAAVEEAFEQGVNYLYWGSYRTGSFGEALRHLAPRRDRVALVLQSYSRLASLVGPSLERALRAIRYEYADVLLLGMWNKPVSPRIVEAARRLQQRGLVRHLALSTHQRPLVASLAGDADFNLFHVRYNAVHRGAEKEVFPWLPDQGGPGLVAFTATCWRKLLGHRRIPKEERVPTAGDCYRFVLSQPAVHVCMTGPGSAAHVREALDALRKGPMSPEELAWMRRVGDAIYGRKAQSQGA